MKIACLTPLKHLSGLFEKMQSYGEVIYEPEIEGPALKKLLAKDKEIDVLYCNPNKQNYKLNSTILAGSGVRVINTASTGLNHINLDDCKELDIEIVSLTNDYELIKNLPSTSELAFGLMLALLRHIPASSEDVKKGEWNYENYMGRQVDGLTAGIIGYGRLGKLMARYAKTFGMRVLVVDPYVEVPTEYEKVSLEKVAAEADVISLHVHVNNETKHMVNEEFISKTKKQPYLINTARGELVDEKAVIDGVKSGTLSGYGADGIEDEFGSRDKSPMIQAAQELNNILIVPHTGGMTWEGQRRAWIYAIDKFKYIKDFLENRAKTIEYPPYKRTD